MKKNRPTSWGKGFLQRIFYFMNLKNQKKNPQKTQLAWLFTMLSEIRGQGVRDRDEKKQVQWNMWQSKENHGRIVKKAELLLQKSKCTAH